MKFTKQKAKEIVEILKNTYPDATCSLDFSTPFEAVVAVVLSAQCTDERVNKTTPALFARCKSIQDFVDIDIKELESLVHPCGFYRNKAANIKACAKKVLEEFGGKVPSTMEKLLTLPGVGRKTINVFLSEFYNEPAFAVDTHVERVSKRLDIVNNDASVIQVENTLMSLMPEENYHMGHHLLLFLGRYHCLSRNPKCDGCPLKKYCIYDKKPLN